jgi:hypothetical protein
VAKAGSSKPFVVTFEHTNPAQCPSLSTQTASFNTSVDGAIHICGFHNKGEWKTLHTLQYNTSTKFLSTYIATCHGGGCYNTSYGMKNVKVKYVAPAIVKK